METNEIKFVAGTRYNETVFANVPDREGEFTQRTSYFKVKQKDFQSQ